MRVTRDFSRTLPASQPRRFWLLALGIALTPLFATPSWADNYNLESVDFVSAGGQTNIIMHTGSIVPVQKVLVSDTKLILDIDQVNTDETVNTNFNRAGGNISHVIMQPLSEHKIRMIIRGEGLGTPSVAFYNASNGAYSNMNPDFDGNRLERETNAALGKLQTDGTKPAIWQGANGDMGEKVAVDTASYKAQADDPIAFGGFLDNKSAKNAPTRTGVAENQEVAPLPLQQGNDSAPAGNDFFEQLAGGKLTTFLPYGLLGLMILGICGFVGHKIIQLKQGEPELEDLLEDQSQGKRVSFRDMANAYRSKHDAQRADKPSGNRRANAEDVIGLRSLHLDDPYQEEAPRTQQPPRQPAASRPVAPSGGKQAANSLEQMIAAMQKAASTPPKPIQTPPAKKQAVNQYLQNQQVQAKSKNRQVADEMMVKEAKRAQAIQQELQQQAQQQRANSPLQMPKPAGKVTPPSAPMNRAPAAQKAIKTPSFQSVPAGNSVNAKTRKHQPPASPLANAKSASQQGPLPGNPEVLNFLRNVADLMEKDGKGQIAKSIHKNLNPNNIGMA